MSITRLPVVSLVCLSVSPSVPWATYLPPPLVSLSHRVSRLPQYGEPSAGGVSHVPPGWDWWVGLVGNSRYYNYTLSVNGTAQKHGDSYEEDYLTDIIVSAVRGTAR